MADRFPSLDDFDSGIQTDIKDPSTEPSADDFLAREKAILGDDANQFATVEDAGADDDFLSPPSGNVQFESQFPDITSSNQGAGVSMTGPSVSYNSGYGVQAEEEAEPEVIREWREKRDAQIAKRSEQFALQREETIKEAQQNIDEFYENYNKKKEKGIAQTRKEAEDFLNGREDVTSGGTSWQRIAKIAGLKEKGGKGGKARVDDSGKERFRELLESLRDDVDGNAPGSGGY